MTEMTSKVKEADLNNLVENYTETAVVKQIGGETEAHVAR